MNTLRLFLASDYDRLCLECSRSFSVRSFDVTARENQLEGPVMMVSGLGWGGTLGNQLELWTVGLTRQLVRS